MNHCDIFQIGAHIGNSHNDPIFHTDLQDKSLVLIEPIPFLFDILKHNYSIKPTSKINFLNVGVKYYDLIQYLKSHGYNIVNEDENDTTVSLSSF
jgi:hypothetical protein